MCTSLGFSFQGRDRSTQGLNTPPPPPSFLASKCDNCNTLTCLYLGIRQLITTAAAAITRAISRHLHASSLRDLIPYTEQLLPTIWLRRLFSLKHYIFSAWASSFICSGIHSTSLFSLCRSYSCRCQSSSVQKKKVLLFHWFHFFHSLVFFFLLWFKRRSFPPEGSSFSRTSAPNLDNGRTTIGWLQFQSYGSMGYDLWTFFFKMMLDQCFSKWGITPPPSVGAAKWQGGVE